MNQLAEFHGQTYKSGLTVNEKSYLSSKQSPLVNEINVQMFKALIAKVITLNSISNLPSDEEVGMMLSMVQKHLPYYRLGELALAFELNSVGKEWERVQAFNIVNANFIFDVMAQFSIYKMKMNMSISQKECKVDVSVAGHLEAGNNNNEGYLRIFLRDVESWSKGQREAVLFLAPHMVRKFYDEGIVSDDTFPDEDWKRWKFSAREKVNAIELEGRRSSKEERFEKIQQEVMRLLYCTIMDSHILKNEVINKLK